MSFCILLLLLIPMLLFPFTGVPESLSPAEMAGAGVVLSPADSANGGNGTGRQEFIEGMIATAKKRFSEAHGKPQQAQYSGDIYICKNFTVHLFRENCNAYRIAAYPDVPLVIPDNRKKEDCAPYAYGVAWKEVPASEGNPFEIAAEFRYDENKSQEENREAALALLRQVRQGDFFQMSAKYYYGTGAHSLVFIADYDPETDEVHWTDSNMKGLTQNGVRYAYVQYDAERDIGWFADAFCHKKRGATLYRLREDIERR